MVLYMDKKENSYFKKNDQSAIFSDLRKKLDDIYTPLEEAKEEIWKRWNDKELKEKVEESLKGDIPEILQKSPRAILSRHLMSPNFELLHFLDLAKDLELEPIGLEYIQDKFVSVNEDKYYLAKLVFYEGIGKKGGRKLSFLKVIDIDLFDGKKFSGIKTLDGRNFIDFHHNLVQPYLGMPDILDMSDYYKRNGGLASIYYKYILSLYICYGVLVENFLLNDKYEDLTKNTLLPVFEKVKNYFGVKPLIVRLTPLENEEDLYWRYYPKPIQDKGICYNEINVVA